MSKLQQVYQKLFDSYGPQFWWPGESSFEIMVGAILTQNTSWKNVALAIENLREAGALTVAAINAMSVEALADLVKPAGYYRLKAKRLANLVSYLVEQCDGSTKTLLARDADVLRRQLLALNGIGPETADSILLYAANIPTFVVDAYTARIVKRHGWIGAEADYYEIKSLFEDQLAAESQLFNEYHALIVQVGKQHCKKSPDCESCPLRELLPDGGPLSHS